MKMNDQCLPCLMSQIVKMTHLFDDKNNDDLYHNVFRYLSNEDFNKINPEILGEVFRIIKEYYHNDDPYLDIRRRYNDLLMGHLDELNGKMNSFLDAISYAIAGNIVDFGPMNQSEHLDVLAFFEHINDYSYSINDSDLLYDDLLKAKKLLYIGDNCGEICLDYLLLKRIKEMNPGIDIYFATRGEPIVNDSIKQDAYDVHIDDYAFVIDNGDYAQGTVLSRVSDEFLDIYHSSDVIIAKGQANLECLSEEKENIYFLLMVKCGVIAEFLSVEPKTFVCLKNNKM